jgi:hypothetical protein
VQESAIWHVCVLTHCAASMRWQNSGEIARPMPPAIGPPCHSNVICLIAALYTGDTNAIRSTGPVSFAHPGPLPPRVGPRPGKCPGLGPWHAFGRETRRRGRGCRAARVPGRGSQAPARTELAPGTPVHRRPARSPALGNATRIDRSRVDREFHLRLCHETFREVQSKYIMPPADGEQYR